MQLLNMQLIKVRSYWGRLGPISNTTSILMKAEGLVKTSTQEDHHVKMGAEVMPLRAKECLGLPEDKGDKEQILSHDPHKESGFAH